MKKLLVLFVAAIAFSPAFAKELAVLTIGNSFANSVWTYLPQMAKATPNCTLVIEGANLGGCTLKRHWKCVQQDDSTGSKSYHNGKASLNDLLTSRKWDVVTLQQYSGDSFKPETFEPYLGQLIDYVKKRAPSAEIVLQQTWAYRVDSPRFTKPDMPHGQKSMADGIEKAYQLYAKKYGLRVIPSGLAVQLVRQSQPTPFKPVAPESIKSLKEPELPDQTGSLCAGYLWTAPKKGTPEEKKTKKLSADFNHLNNQGKYIQACVWLSFLFDIDAETITYTSKDISAENAKLYKKCAKQAIEQGKVLFPTK